MSLYQNSSNPKVKIFVSHRIDLVSETIDSPVFQHICSGSAFDEREDKPNILNDNTGDNISDKNRSYCELTAQYWAWKNVKADYYGLCHYRRYLSFSDKHYPVSSEVRNNGCVTVDRLTDEIIKEHGLDEETICKELADCDIVTIEPIDLVNWSGRQELNNYMAMQESPDYHIMKDVDMVLQIIKEKTPWMYSAATSYMNNKISYLYNCYIMSAEIFNDYNEWLFGVLSEFEKRIDMSKYTTQQYRTPATLAERLFGIYITYLEQKKEYRIKRKQLLFIEHPEPQEELLQPFFKDNYSVIVSNFDSNYVPLASVFLTSAIENFSDDHNYDIIFLSRDITIEQKKQLQDMCKNRDNIALRFYNPEWTLRNVSVQVRSGVYTNDIYYRVMVPYILKNYTKAAVIDVDTICMADLKELYETDIDQYLAAAVRDTVWTGWLSGFVPHHFQYTLEMSKNLSNSYDYCNTGVILMNLEAIRSCYSFENTQKFMHSREFSIYEQDMLNELYDMRMKFLDPAWNLFTRTNKFVEKSLTVATATDARAYLKARKSPKIIHYAASPKPWNTGTGDFAIEFWQYARKSPYYEYLLAKMRVQPNEMKHAETCPCQKVAIRILPYGSRRHKIAKHIWQKSNKILDLSAWKRLLKRNVVKLLYPLKSFFNFVRRPNEKSLPQKRHDQILKKDDMPLDNLNIQTIRSKKDAA